MLPLIGLEKLPIEVKHKIRPFLDALLALHERNILAIFIYGSATGINYIPKKSDINSVVVFREVHFQTFKDSLKIIRKGMTQGIRPPLFLTREYIASSVDVFPIEFLEMKENHVLIYGEDILSSMSIEEQYIRIFCEQQLKGTLMKIRQFYLQWGYRLKEIEYLLKSSLNSLIPIFRNLIRLKERIPAVEKSALLKQLAAEFNLTTDVFLHVYTSTTSGPGLIKGEFEPLLEQYLQEIEKLIKKVDKR